VEAVVEVVAIHHLILFRLIHKVDMQEVGHIIMAIVEVQVIATLIAIVKINLRRFATLAQAVMVLAVSSEMMVPSQAMAAVVTKRDVLHVAMNTGTPLSIVMKRAEFVMEEGIKSINNKFKTNTYGKEIETGYRI